MRRFNTTQQQQMMASELRQRKKGQEEEEAEEAEEVDTDSPVLVEREDDDEESEEEEEEEEEEEDGDEEEDEAAAAPEEDALTRRLREGFARNPMDARRGAPPSMPVPKRRRAGAGGTGRKDGEGEKGGIRWMPIIFLLFMVMPAIFTAVDYLLQLPFFARFRGPPPYRQCLTDYYRRVHPERLQEVDIGSILRKYKGQEAKLARNLETRYGRKFKCP